MSKRDSKGKRHQTRHDDPKPSTLSRGPSSHQAALNARINQAKGYYVGLVVGLLMGFWFGGGFV